eukprot:403363220
MNIRNDAQNLINLRRRSQDFQAEQKNEGNCLQRTLTNPDYKQYHQQSFEQQKFKHIELQDKTIHNSRNLNQTSANLEDEEYVFQMSQEINQEKKLNILEFKAPINEEVPKFHNNILQQQFCDVIPIREDEQTKQSQIAKVTQITCEICFQIVQDEHLIFMLECGHEYCKECLLDMLTFAINNSGKIEKLTCPNQICTCRISDSYVRKILGPETDENANELFQKYTRFMADYEIMHMQDRKYCPVPNCDNIIQGKNGLKKTRCIKCQKDICYSCQTIWHQGQSCSKYQAKNFQQFSQAVGARRCPKCNVIIQKIEGCNEMTCYKCGHDFCWLCGEALNSVLHKHLFRLLRCQRFTVQGQLNMKLLTIRYALLFFFMPFITLFLPWGFIIFVTLFGPIACSKAYIRKQPLMFYLCSCCLFPLWLVIIGIGIAIGALAGVICLLLFCLPFQVILLYYYIRIRKWWGKSRLIKVQK